jgi:hypothetical protein
MVQDALDAGELRKTTDLSQLVFELRGITLAFHQELHVMRSPTARKHADNAVSALVERYLAAKPLARVRRGRAKTRPGSPRKAGQSG